MGIDATKTAQRSFFRQDACTGRGGGKAGGIALKKYRSEDPKDFEIKMPQFGIRDQHSLLLQTR